MRFRGPRDFAAITLTLLLISCGLPRIRHEYTLAPGKGFHAGYRTALLIPIDSLSEDAFKNVESTHDRIERLIVSHLEARGLRVETLTSERFKEAANEAARALIRERTTENSDLVSTHVEFVEIVPRMLSNLGTPADLVVVPSIVRRVGRYNGASMINWDGVGRKEEMRLDHAMTGTTSVLSLHVIVFSRDGERLFEGFGGLDPLFRPDVRLRQYVVRDNVLQDEDHLGEGICVAFHPFFGEQEYCRH